MHSQRQAAGSDVQIIPPATRMGAVHLTVASLAVQVAFYRDVLSFQEHWREGATVGLGAGGEDLLRLTELSGAQRVRGATGLYHTAFLLPRRVDLAHLLQRIAETESPIQGLTDHGTHQAIYLPDAEGNGIELAWDYPDKSQWPRTMHEMMQRNRGLYPEEIFSALAEDPTPWQGLPLGTTIGHVHLQVADIPTTRTFYHGLLGFNVTFEYGPQAMFFAAGDYHHHLGGNTWAGEGAPPPPPGAQGLRHFTIVLPDAAALDDLTVRIETAGVEMTETDEGLLLRDPSQNGVILRAAESGS
jgi:catechol 2,3-dioxygenase